MTIAAPVPSGRDSWVEATFTSAGLCGLSGTLAGLVWGGFGGRFAMRVLLLTSDERVRGVTSDDGFEIGVISVATVFLLIFTAILGTIAGFLYGALRMVTAGPTWLVAVGVCITAGATGGAALVNSDGIDFVLLEPLWLAIGLFVVIPAAWGVTVVYLARFLMRPGTFVPTLPNRIDQHRWGATGWIVLAALTAFGLFDLMSDIDRLN